MNLIGLSWAYIRAKPLSNLLNVGLVGLGVGLASILLLLNTQFETRLYKNIENINLVVSAKGSPLQMILSSVYHIDVPTGNIPLKDAWLVTKNPYVEKAIPLALGDSYKGFRIVGTNKEYANLYKVQAFQGRLWEKDLEVCVGARAAAKLGLKIGSTFYGAHGLVGDDDMHTHEEFVYKVVGILEKSGTVIDQLILTNVSSVWRVHESHEHGEETPEEETGDSTQAHTHSHDEPNSAPPVDTHVHTAACNHDHDGHNHDGHDHDGHSHAHPIVATNPDSLAPISEEGKEVTAYLVQYKKDKTGAVSAMATNMVPRMIKEGSEKMGSALPAYELQRLLEMTGVGASFLSSLAWLIIGVSGFSVFISLYNSLKERRYELALMRVMGASKGKIFALLILEGLLLSGLGVVFGLFMSHLGMSLLAGSLEKAYQYEFSGLIFLMGELWLGLGMLGLGFLAALFPAWSAYKADISKQLQ